LLVAIFRPQGVPRQRNSITGDFVDSQNGKMLAPLGRNSLLVFILRRLLPSSAVASDLIFRSRWVRATSVPAGLCGIPIEINTTSRSSRRLRSFAGPQENRKWAYPTCSSCRRLTADDHVLPRERPESAHLSRRGAVMRARTVAPDLTLPARTSNGDWRGGGRPGMGAGPCHLAADCGTRHPLGNRSAGGAS
jgi:hypothetical protein